MKQFNVIIYNINKNDIESYDVIPYFIKMYEQRVKANKKNPDNDYFKVPSNKKELKEFIKGESQYQFWGRCQYEIIIVDWPSEKYKRKIDVHEQIMMNIDLITDIVAEELKIK